MARNGISYSDVKQAIDEMQSEGLNPTIAGLRERLGTGSFTTISEHLKRWRSERQQQPMIAGGTPAPDNLNSMVQAVWQQAREDATKELESYKQEIQKTLDQAEEEKQQAIEQAVATNERNKWLEDKNNALLEEIRELEKQKGILTTKIENCEEENRELSTHLESAKADLASQQQNLEELKEKQRKELAQFEERSQQERHKLHSDLQETLKLFEQQLNEERKRSEASEQHWIAQIDIVRQQLKASEHKYSNLEATLQRILKQHEASSKESESALATIKNKIEQTQAQQAAIELKVDQARADFKEITGTKDLIDTFFFELNKQQRILEQNQREVIELIRPAEGEQGKGEKKK